MSFAQRIVLIIGVVALTVVLAFPEWIVVDRFGQTTLYTRPMWAVQAGSESSLSTDTMLFRVGIVSALIATGWLVLGVPPREP